jgi:hypothetical protein
MTILDLRCGVESRSFRSRYDVNIGVILQKKLEALIVTSGCTVDQGCGTFVTCRINVRHIFQNKCQIFFTQGRGSERYHWPIVLASTDIDVGIMLQENLRGVAESLTDSGYDGIRVVSTKSINIGAALDQKTNRIFVSCVYGRCRYV